MHACPLTSALDCRVQMRTCFKRALIAVGLLGLTVALSVPADAQGISKDQADAMLQELKQIRLLLQQMQRQNVTPADRPAAPPAKVKVSLGDGPALGEETAPVTLVEFTDYQCPFCQKFQTETFEQLKKNYIDSGKLRFVSRDLPLPFHPHALEAAQAARCAGEQGKFWELRDVLISNGNKLSPETILDYAKGLSLDTERFRQCFDSKKYQAEFNAISPRPTVSESPGPPHLSWGRLLKTASKASSLMGPFRIPNSTQGSRNFSKRIKHQSGRKESDMKNGNLLFFKSASAPNSPDWLGNGAIAFAGQRRGGRAADAHTYSAPNHCHWREQRFRSHLWFVQTAAKPEHRQSPVPRHRQSGRLAWAEFRVGCSIPSIAAAQIFHQCP